MQGTGESGDEGAWARIRDGAVFAGRDGAVWRISVRPTDGPRLAAALAPAEVVFDWSGGLIWALVSEETDLRAAMAGIPGHATLVRASALAEARWGALPPEPAPVAALSDGLRRRFDPHGILNPGRMGARAPQAA
jgi:glycolate oxidase FAD binding subunit